MSPRTHAGATGQTNTESLMTETKETLDARGASIEAEVARLDREIAERIADGDADQALVGKLRAKRRELMEEHGDLGEALTLVRERETNKVQAERDRTRREAMTKARQDADELLAAASAVDAALDAAHGRMRLAALDLSRSLRLSGNADAGRLAYSLGPAMRWAAWSMAPGASEDMQVPRATGTRRRPLRESAERLIPAIGE